MVRSNRPRHRDTIRRIHAIASREFLSVVLTKGFILGILVLPVIILFGVILLPFMMSDGQHAVEGTILIIDPSNTVAAQSQTVLDERLAETPESSTTGHNDDLESLTSRVSATNENIQVTFQTTTRSEEELKNAVREGSVLAYAVVPAELLQSPPASDASFSIGVANFTSPSHTGLFTKALRTGIVRARIEASGQDYAVLSDMLADPESKTVRLSREGGEAPENLAGRMMVPMGFMMLMWMAVFTSANQLLTSTIEEKSNKVIEVLLAAASPFELLAGKILGQGLVSALLLLIYGGLGIVGLVAATMGDLISWQSLLLLLAYSVTAYLMIAAMMAAVGSAVNDLKEAQSLVTPVMMVVMIPLILWLPISENPNGALATVTSFVPPLIPFVMILRSTGTMEPLPVWQVPVTLLLSALSSVMFIWIAARIFRVGVLMQGKTPTPMELLRWARAR
ncbi:MAG: ABC transporter permease [Planctomycetota bacterium]|nr:ABC transporter permease [Planctomycetota bacterium]